MDLPDSEKQRILLVEDDLEISELLCAFLRKRAFEVFACLNGADALSLFQARAYAVVLLDSMLPDKDGYTVCREMRSVEKGRRTPIIFLSALAQKGDIEKGLDAGADLYLTKPYENAVLLEHISKLVALR
jgi:two-component system response regulator MtrA